MSELFDDIKKEMLSKVGNHIAVDLSSCASDFSTFIVATKELDMWKVRPQSDNEMRKYLESVLSFSMGIPKELLGKI